MNIAGLWGFASVSFHPTDNAPFFEIVFVGPEAVPVVFKPNSNSKLEPLFFSRSRVENNMSGIQADITKFNFRGWPFLLKIGVSADSIFGVFGFYDDEMAKDESMHEETDEEDYGWFMRFFFIRRPTEQLIEVITDGSLWLNTCYHKSAYFSLRWDDRLRECRKHLSGAELCPVSVEPWIATLRSDRRRFQGDGHRTEQQ